MLIWLISNTNAPKGWLPPKSLPYLNRSHIKLMTNTFDRAQLVEDYVQQIIDSMDMKTMKCFVYDTLKDNLVPYSDEELIAEVKEYNPELLEDWLVTLIIQRLDKDPFPLVDY